MGRSHGQGRAEAEGSGSNRQEEAAAAFWGPFCSQLPDLPTLRVCTYLPTTYPPYYLTPNSVWVCLYRLYPKTRIIPTVRSVLSGRRAFRVPQNFQRHSMFPDLMRKVVGEYRVIHIHIYYYGHFGWFALTRPTLNWSSGYYRWLYYEFCWIEFLEYPISEGNVIFLKWIFSNCKL